MEHIHGALEDTVTSTLDHELDLVSEAVQMVASGRSTRVVLAGLWFGDQLLGSARQMAAGRQVHVEALWGPDESHADLVIERAADG